MNKDFGQKGLAVRADHSGRLVIKTPKVRGLVDTLTYPRNFSGWDVHRRKIQWLG
jgi:hypothetical protein